MQINQRPMFQVLHREGGFTLLEVLVAMALLTIAIVGVAGALGGASGVNRGADFGLAAVTRANAYSTATELGQARIEEIKNATYNTATDQITTANFPNEAYGTIAGFQGFRRTVTINLPTPPPVTKTITVQVFFIPEYATNMGQGQEESILLSTIIAQRP